MMSSYTRLLGHGAAALGLCLALASGCTYSHGDAVAPCNADPATTTYAATVAPIIQLNCRNSCHNATLREGGVNFDDFTEVEFYALNGEIVRRIQLDPGHPDFMPKNHGKLAPCDIARIKAWVDAGALNN